MKTHRQGEHIPVQFWVTWALIHIMIQIINGNKPKDLEKAMTDSLCEYELDYEAQEKVLHARKKFFPMQGQKGHNRAKLKVNMSAPLKDECPWPSAPT